MTDTFDWAGLVHEIMSAEVTFGVHAASDVLSTRIEAAFVPVAAYTATAEAAATHLKGKIEATARAQAAEAENARLREPLREALEHWDYCRVENRDPRSVPECWTVPTRQALGDEHE